MSKNIKVRINFSQKITQSVFTDVGLRYKKKNPIFAIQARNASTLCPIVMGTDQLNLFYAMTPVGEMYPNLSILDYV